MELVRAAQYLRMSTEHQRYSPENQGAAIADYARARGYELVKTYRDDGVSGVSMRGREGLKALLADVVGGDPGFQTILVYDVSRWGRFQNPDQAAHYEFLCAEVGVAVEYCAEPFVNDGGAASTILKALKRVMAAEYSRELSVKVAAGQRRLAACGYWQGGRPGYGYRRMVVNAAGKPVGVLTAGEFKAVDSHRTVLVPAPAPEPAIIQRIFHAFAVVGVSQHAIAAQLNAEGVKADGGGQWTYTRVHHILRNPKYVGDLATQKTSGNAFSPRRTRKPADWVIVRNACPPLVPRKLFRLAQERLATKYHYRTKDELLDLLRRVHAIHGELTHHLLRRLSWTPGPEAFRRRFGSLSKACAAAGIAYPERPQLRRRWPDRTAAMRLLAELYQREGRLTAEMIAAAPDLPHPSTYRQICGNLTNAYAIVGYTPMTKAGRASCVGRARLAASRVRLCLALGRAVGTPSAAADAS